MDTTERMMIMGMCLQGLLANPAWSKTKVPDKRMVPNVLAGCVGEPEEIEDIFYRPMNDAEEKTQRAALIREAHLLADALDPPPEVTDAERIMKLTRTAYGVLVAADADGAGRWLPFEDARTSAYNDDQDRVDGVFERVSRWYADPIGVPETIQDRIIAAVVAASRE